MANPSRRGQVTGPVSTQIHGDSETPFANTSFILPYGLQLRQKVGMVDITNVTASGGTVTYTAANNYSAGNTVSIYDINPVSYNLRNVTIASASSTQFTVTSAATGTYVSGGIAQRTGEIPVTIPSGITFVYAIAVGAGGVGGQGGGGAGGLSWGWTLASSSCVVGTGFTAGGGYTRYGNVIAGGGQGGGANGVAGVGAGGGGGNNGASGNAGSTNYWGIPPGSGVNANLNGNPGAGGGGGGGTFSNTTGGRGGDGISGGGGGSTAFTTSSTLTGGNGGNGLIGGGGARSVLSTTLNLGGNGGNGFNILTGQITTGGTGASQGSGGQGSGGGGGGIVTNGSDGITTGGVGGAGGLGGGGGGGANSGGQGGAGVLYLFY